MIFLIFILGFTGISGLRCACENDAQCHGSDVCSVREGGICFTSIFKDEDGLQERTMRCLQPEQALPKGRPFLCQYNRKLSHKYVSECCSDRNYCNMFLNLVLNTTLTPVNDGQNQSETHHIWLPVVVTSVVLLFFVCLIVVYVTLVTKNRSKPVFCCMDRLVKEDHGYHQVEIKSPDSIQNPGTAGITAVTGSELNDYYSGASTNSGSGSGLPLLVQRSVARQV